MPSWIFSQSFRYEMVLQQDGSEACQASTFVQFGKGILDTQSIKMDLHAWSNYFLK